MRELYSEDFEQIFASNGEELSAEEMTNLTRGISIALEKGSQGTLLPAARIYAELYCAKERAVQSLTSNDWFDFQIAAVALPYCDFLLTEKHLKHQILTVS